MTRTGMSATARTRNRNSSSESTSATWRSSKTRTIGRTARSRSNAGNADKPGEAICRGGHREARTRLGQRQQHLGPRPERCGAPILDTATPVHGGACRQCGDELADQPGLADARFTTDQHRNELPGTGCVERVRENEQLLGAANKGRQEIRGHQRGTLPSVKLRAIAVSLRVDPQGSRRPPLRDPCRTPLFD